ncbi:MAG: SDR family oxidoreductase [Myxococcota bacterium]
MTVLVTGYPSSFLARRVADLLLSQGKTVRCVVQRKHMEDAEAHRNALDDPARLELIEGDVASLDLGLSGAEFNALASEVEVIHHCAAVTYLGADRRLAEQTNIGGAREILELAEAGHGTFQRLVFWSSALVSGARKGRVLEEELGDGPFRNAVDETRMRAERIVRDAMDHVPTTILRPSIVVGDSQTGEIDRLEGPYLLVLLMLNAPQDLRMPMPGRGDAPLNLVPIDFVVRAGLTIAEHPEAVGQAFHIVDPAPRSARQVFELIAEAAGRAVPRGYVPTSFATALMRTPGLERFANVPRTFLEQLTTDVVWDARRAEPILRDAKIRGLQRIREHHGGVRSATELSGSCTTHVSFISWGTPRRFSAPKDHLWNGRSLRGGDASIMRLVHGRGPI